MELSTVIMKYIALPTIALPIWFCPERGFRHWSVEDDGDVEMYPSSRAGYWYLRFRNAPPLREPVSVVELASVLVEHGYSPFTMEWHVEQVEPSPRYPWPQPEQPNPAEYVYFAFSHQHQAIKIGYSTNLPQRMISLFGSDPAAYQLLGIFRGTLKQEHACHLFLDEWRATQVEGREWFLPTQEVYDFIEKHCTPELLSTFLQTHA